MYEILVLLDFPELFCKILGCYRRFFNFRSLNKDKLRWNKCLTFELSRLCL